MGFKAIVYFRAALKGAANEQKKKKGYWNRGRILRDSNRNEAIGIK